MGNGQALPEVVYRTWINRSPYCRKRVGRFSEKKNRNALKKRWGSGAAKPPSAEGKGFAPSPPREPPRSAARRAAGRTRPKCGRRYAAGCEASRRVWLALAIVGRGPHYRK